MLRIRKTILVFMFAGVAGALTPFSLAAQTATQKTKDCLLIDDMTKERLDCFDAIFPPAPKPSAQKAKNISECKFYKEEDERLICYNGFVAPRKQPPKAPKSKAPPKTDL